MSEFKAGTEAETMEIHCSLAHYFWPTQLLLLYSPGLPEQEWHFPQWAGPWYINYQLTKCPTDIIATAMGQSDLENSSPELLFSQVTMVCVKLTSKATYDKSYIYFKLLLSFPQFWDSLYILVINPLSVIRFSNGFSCSVNQFYSCGNVIWCIDVFNIFRKFTLFFAFSFLLRVLWF